MFDWLKRSGGKNDAPKPDSRKGEEALLEAVAEGIYLTDINGAVVFMNKAAREILGYEAGEIIGKDSHKVFHYAKADGTPNPAENCPFMEAMRAGAARKFTEEVFCAKDGRRIPVDCTASPIRDNGRIMGLAVAFSDTTERRLSHAALKKARDEAELVFQLVPSAIYTVDARRRVLSWNRKAAEITGFSAEEVLGRPCDVFADMPCRNRCGLLDENVPKPISCAECTIRTKNGPVRIISKNADVLRNAKGEVIGGIESFEDITERKLAEERLAGNEATFRAITSSAQDAILMMDNLGNISFWNPAAERLLGWKAEEALGKNLADLIVPERFREAHKNALPAFRRTGEGGAVGKTLELAALKKDSAEIAIELSMSGVKLKGEWHAVGILRDITARKKAADSLRESEAAQLKAREAAEAANRAKSDFLANMSHEIRTPMNSIIGMTEILLDSRLDENQKRHLQTIQRSADALLYIISDILDISKIEAGLLKIERAPYDPREVAESVAEMFAQRAADKGLELVLKVSTDLPASVFGDGNRLRQILINLVGNAFKFTLKGQIKLSAEFLKGGAAGWLVFSVADTGIGISAENQKKLFSKFSQVDDSSTRKYGGTGLGLSISKALVEMMDGSISLESGEGKGSVFSFRLPCSEAPAGPPRREEHVSFAGMRALLVDDNTDSLEILAQNMAAWGFSTASARSTHEALELLKNAGKFDLLVVDHQMPGGDGEQFIVQALAGGAAGSARIMMLSSRVEVIPESVKPAVSAFLSKPITRSTLFNAILKVFRPAAAPEASAEAAAPRHDYSHLRILVAEDNADNQNLVRLMLENAGYRLDIAANGREALEKCAAFDYDLVLMDIQMPEMDGNEAAFQLRKTGAYKKTPILALTAHGLDSDVKKSLSFGMNAHITKPLKKKVLYEALDKWLDTRRKVLIVDDNPDNLALVELDLKEEAGLRLYRASNGKEALEMLKRTIFSLVLLDMEMPVMDGLAAVKELRNTATGKAVPVVAFSAHDSPLKIRECLDAGCTDYLLKPVKKAGLLEKVRKYL